MIIGDDHIADGWAGILVAIDTGTIVTSTIGCSETGDYRIVVFTTIKGNTMTISTGIDNGLFDISFVSGS